MAYSVKKHGMSKVLLYRLWGNMIQRCHNKRSKDYPRWGARGITVCKRWRDFNKFHTDMAPRPRGCSLDRKNNNKGYSKANCRWATSKEQSTC